MRSGIIMKFSRYSAKVCKSSRMEGLIETFTLLITRLNCMGLIRKTYLETVTRVLEDCVVVFVVVGYTKRDCNGMYKVVHRETWLKCL